MVLLAAPPDDTACEPANKVSPVETPAPRFGHGQTSTPLGWADMATIVPIVEHAALATIRPDDEDPRAHYALGSVYLFQRRFDDSLAEFELAPRLKSNFSLAQGYYGLTLSYCARCNCWGLNGYAPQC